MRALVSLLVWGSWSSAWAAPPDKVAAALPTGLGTPGVLALAAGGNDARGDIMVTTTSQGALVLLDLDRWALVGAEPCAGNATSAAATWRDDAWQVYTGCDDSTIVHQRYDGASLVTDAGVEPIDLGQGAPVAMLPVGGTLVVVAEPESGAISRNELLIDVSLSDDSVEAASGIVALPTAGFLEALTPPTTTTTTSTTLYVAQGDIFATALAVPTNVSPGLGTSIGLGAETRDAALSNDLSTLLLADPDNGLFTYLPTSLTATLTDGTLSNLRAIGTTPAWSDPLTVFAEGRTLSFRGAAFISPEQGSLTLEEPANDIAAGPEGYLVVAADAAGIYVLTANPWIDGLTLSPTSAVAGDEVTVTFTPDTAGAVSLFGGGGRGGDGDTLLDAPLSVAAGVQATATFVVPESADEGSWPVWARLVEVGGSVGHAKAILSVDNAPVGLSLTDDDLRPADGALVLTFEALSASDIVAYDVYVSETAFTAADFPTGGPTGEVSGGLSSPVEVTPEDGESVITVRLTPLTNGVTYHVAVRARDASQEGPMSTIVSDYPEATTTLGGGRGVSGPACASGPASLTGGGAPWGLLALAAGLVAARRRRVARSAAMGAVVAGLLAVGGPARAQDQDEGETTAISKLKAAFERDQTPAWGSFEVRGGSFNPAWSELDTYYGNLTGLQLEIGPQIFRVLEVDFGLTYLWRKSTLPTTGGRVSGDEGRLQVVPITLGLTGRVHIVDEQPVVPHASVGLAWYYFRETPLDSDGAAIPSGRTVGSHGGWYWQAGGDILLDWLAPKRASQLEGATGINDTWLTLNYRQQSGLRPDDSGFDLSGWSFNVGLKLDW